MSFSLTSESFLSSFSLVLAKSSIFLSLLPKPAAVNSGWNTFLKNRIKNDYIAGLKLTLTMHNFLLSGKVAMLKTVAFYGQMLDAG